MTEHGEVTAVVIMDHFPAQCDVYLGQPHWLRGLDAGLLDSSEQARARGYLLADARDRFLFGALLLRTAAGHHLGVRPADVPVDRTCQWCESQHGRPVLAGTGLHASVSHSGGVVAVAITRAGPVGVDVEAGRAIDVSAVADSVCTTAERASVTGLGDFYAYWTRKEAILKATGDGLRRPMTDLSITPPGSAPVLLALGSDAAPACQMADISAGDGYHAAVAVLTARPVVFGTHDASTLLAS
ncbi:MAG TPA: 4'-phosphopantetheinyl transferase superfamily protein [Streptosporangiaceae bacterium]|nr:4'-phosphopantetheinyl transferase superfamily protein [Streptosporangiaceae bacterium]